MLLCRYEIRASSPPGKRGYSSMVIMSLGSGLVAVLLVVSFLPELVVLSFPLPLLPFWVFKLSVLGVGVGLLIGVLSFTTIGIWLTVLGLGGLGLGAVVVRGLGLGASGGGLGVGGGGSSTTCMVSGGVHSSNWVLLPNQSQPKFDDDCHKIINKLNNQRATAKLNQ